MSLELAAQHLASRGRKGDSMLVHMAPEEVSGLQALAMAGGGTLTLNPDTGLPEANFLKRMLPTLIGAGLMFATGGTAAPLIAGLSNATTIGLGLGALETARTGSLEKGIMAGLGAYGGAGLTGGLMSAGAGAQTAAAQQAAMKAVPESALSAGATEPITGAIGQGIQAGAVPGVAAPGVSQYALGNGTMYGGGTGLTAGGSGFGFNPATAASQTATITPELTRQGVLNQAALDATKSFTPTGGMEQLKAGLGNLNALPVKDMAKSGLAAMVPMMQVDPAAPYDGGKANYEYTYDPNTSSYTRVPVGTRDKMGRTPSYYAAGGPIEEMSDRNQMQTMMANGGQMFAAGGQVNLQGTFTAGDQGGGGPFGQANANGYQAAGSGGPIPGFSSSFGQMGGGDSNMLTNMGGNTRGGSLFSGGFGAPGQIDPRAVQADPEGFQRWQQMSQQREQQMPGSTMLGGGIPSQQQALIGGLGGYGAAMRSLGNRGASNPMANIGGGSPTQQSQGAAMVAQMSPEQRYEMYAASNDRRLAERMQPGNMTMSHDYVGPTMSRADFDASQNSPRNSAAMFAAGGMASMAQGGPSHLGDYSDGGRLLKGPGDGVSDSIPATIANKRPARLADGEFVVPARIVSELGNGSTEAGARKLYAMMDRVQKARGKTTGKNRVAVNSRAEKLLPA